MSGGNEREFIDHQQNKEKEKQAMKCPLLTKYEDIGDFGGCFAVVDCLKEECAWWDHNHGVCGEKVKKKALDSIALSLADIEAKMPYYAKFRK